MGALRSEAFLAFADAQLTMADVYLRKHDHAGLDLCRCGRLHPCDERRHWLAVADHYRAYVGSE